MNEMMPNQGQAQPSASPQPQSSPLDLMNSQHDMMRTQLEKVEASQEKAKAVRLQLDHLTQLGDLVSPDDVMESASKAVASGVDPTQMAQMLAMMPEGGEALKSWISGQDQQFRIKEQQLNGILNIVRHETGLAALRLLAAQHMGRLDEAFPGAPPEGNGLMPQAQRQANPGLSPPNLGVDATRPALNSPGPAPTNALMESPDNAS